MKGLIIFALASTAVVFAQEKEPRFSIGLGVLAPSYSQKFAGNGRLDVDHNKNGFSYSLNNVPHPSSGSSASYQSQSNPQQSAPAYQSTSGSDYSPQEGQFNIYQHRSVAPKQTLASQSESAYHSPEEDDGQWSESKYGSGLYGSDQFGSAPQSHGSAQQSQGSPHQSQQQYQVQSNLEHSPSSGGAQSYGGPQEYNNEPDYNSDGQSGATGGQNGPRFGAYNFEEQISHQFQDDPQYQSGGAQSYQPQSSQPQSYQSQPSQHRVISLAQPIQRASQLQYKPQPIYAFRV